MAEVGLLPFARVALQVATQVLPPYRSRFSKHRFTQPQLLAVLCLMRYEDWTFREAEVRLREHHELRAALRLRAVPDYTTLYRFLRRLEDDTVDRGLHGFLQSAIDGIILQPPQKTIQRGVVGHRPQSQCGAQLVVLAQAYFGFAKSPVFVAHQAQHRQQLRLGEPMFAEATAVGWQNLRGHLQRHASKGQESDLGHRPSCSIRKHRKPLLVDPWLRKLCRGCQQSLP